jgi:hypothetical protein
MRAFVVEKGVKGWAMKDDGAFILKEKEMKCEKMYFLEDIVLDPIGHIEGSIGDKVLENDLRSEGYFGFRLGENKEGWAFLFVRADNVIVN